MVLCTGLQVGDADLHAKNCKGENEMNNKKLIALLLAAMMSVSTASVAFAAPIVSNSPVVYGDTNNNLTDDIDEPACVQLWVWKMARL